MANLSSSTPHMEAAASRPDAPGGGLPGKVHGPRYLQLFKYAQGYDKWLIVLGMLGAAGEGVGPAVIYVVMDYLVNSFGSLQDDPSKMRKQVNKYATYLVYTAIGSSIATYICERRSAAG